MKHIFALCLLSVSTVSFSADRSIFDLMYLPNAGTTYGQTDFNLIKGETKTPGNDSEETGYLFQQTLGHSVCDRFLLSAQLDWQNTKTDLDFGPNQKEKGLSDPSLDARYRVVDKALMVDILAGFTFSTGDRKIDGNEFDHIRGGHSLRAGAQVGQKEESFQWAASGIVNRNFKAKTKVTGGGSFEDDAYNSYGLGASVLKKLAEETYLLGQLAATFADDYDDNNNSKNPSSTTYDLTAGARQILSQDLMFQVALTYTQINQESGQIDSSSKWNLNAALRYQF
ncbi:MAG TPA: hypothetical protein VNJ01_06355 [Bacteriovoracaceae bacterium]|nr:hypothetical protein [Bacteriovoracaceae bacterium]